MADEIDETNMGEEIGDTNVAEEIGETNVAEMDDYKNLDISRAPIVARATQKESPTKKVRDADWHLMDEQHKSESCYLRDKAQMNGHEEANHKTPQNRRASEIERRSSPRSGISEVQVLNPDVASWSVSHVVAWVQTIDHLEGNPAMEIGTILQEQGVTGPVLLNLTDEHALELGISRFGVRKALLLAIQSLRDNNGKYTHVDRKTKKSTSPPKQQLATQPTTDTLRHPPLSLRHELPTTVQLEKSEHVTASKPATSVPTSNQKTPLRVIAAAQTPKRTPASKPTPMTRPMFTPINIPSMRCPGIQTARAANPSPIPPPTPTLRRGNSVLIPANNVGSITCMTSRMNHSGSTSLLSTMPSFTNLPMLPTPTMPRLQLSSLPLRAPQVFATRVRHQQYGMQRLVVPVRKEKASVMMGTSVRRLSASQPVCPIAGPA
eukprot:GEMP01025914.1.p1 GENE.GEMP01025914.1~~GEMP01025914.1.p1  ORF type:complete len:435 (+),score=112.38 GEMP01025914.1:528-1832(+)